MSKKGNKISGDAGEGRAVAWLGEKGYRILERNYRIPSAEIDIIAERNGTVVFVEVKYRRSSAFGDPFEAVNPKKQAKIVRAAQHYVAKHGLEGRDLRFDVVSILGDEVSQIEGAFVVEKHSRSHR